VDPDEEQKRLSHAVAPEYPDAARQAGIEGDVTMRVVVGPDGAVNGIKLLSGDPALARAAMESVAQWRYAPALLDGWPVSVATTVTVAFRLH
jgi:protein TonB